MATERCQQDTAAEDSWARPRGHLSSQPEQLSLSKTLLLLQPRPTPGEGWGQRAFRGAPSPSADHWHRLHEAPLTGCPVGPQSPWLHQTGDPVQGHVGWGQEARTVERAALCVTTAPGGRRADLHSLFTRLLCKERARRQEGHACTPRQQSRILPRAPRTQGRPEPVSTCPSRLPGPPAKATPREAGRAWGSETSNDAWGGVAVGTRAAGHTRGPLPGLSPGLEDLRWEPALLTSEPARQEPAVRGP